MRGVEDEYSPQNEEPARADRVGNLSITGRQRQVGYDYRKPDGEVVDYFDVPARVASGLLVLKMRPMIDPTTEIIRIGDLSALPRESDLYEVSFRDLKKNAVWRRSNDVHWAALSDLRFRSGISALDFVRSGAKALDVSVADDVSVDFIGLAVCTAPDKRFGMTFHHVPRLSDAGRDLAVFTCVSAEPGAADCNAWAGDTPCDQQRPLLCYADRGLRAPFYPDADEGFWRTRRWSGGAVAATAPVRGDAFASIADADRFCADRFGSAWRTADFHAGGGWGFSALAGGKEFSGRHWVDIRDQPHATCWGRS
jgi:hypothetical protein